LQQQGEGAGVVSVSPPPTVAEDRNEFIELITQVQELREVVDAVEQQQKRQPCGEEAPRTPSGEAPALSGPDLEAALVDKIAAEVQADYEAKLTSMWGELKTHAQAAASRADQLEVRFGSRVAKVEAAVSDALGGSLKPLPSQQLQAQSPPSGVAEGDTEKSLKEHSRELEWLKWRITWLEWSTKGEERAFGRPLDSKALSQAALLPPAHTAVATAFNQPLAEDVELWARESGGRQRLRRPLGTTAKVELLLLGGGGGGGSHASPPGRGSSLRRGERNVRSTGRLPNIA